MWWWSSVLVFDAEQVAAIVDFVAHTYYRHFQLYKSIYTPFRHVYLVQQDVNGVQKPPAPRPLAEGLMLVRNDEATSELPTTPAE